MAKFLEYNYEEGLSEGLLGFSYKVYIPSGYKKGTKVPLMVMVHGCKQNPDDFAAGTKMNEQAEKENFIVLYPYHPIQVELGNPDGCWRWFTETNQHRQAGGEPDIIVGMINQVKKNYSIDSNRVYAAGLSSGAAMTSILGATYPEVFSGIGICSGGGKDGNIGFSIPLSQVISMIEDWSAHPDEGLSAKSTTSDLQLSNKYTSDSLAQDASYLIQSFYENINSGDYVTAYSLLGSDWRNKTSYETFRQG